MGLGLNEKKGERCHWRISPVFFFFLKRNEEKCSSIHLQKKPEKKYLPSLQQMMEEFSYDTNALC